MAVSVIIQKTGSGEEKKKTSISSPLITTEPQAITVGKQELWDWYYRHKEYRLSVPYRGLIDGDIVGVYSIDPMINSKYKIESIQINITKNKGVMTEISLEGEYDDPFN